MWLDGKWEMNFSGQRAKNIVGFKDTAVFSDVKLSYTLQGVSYEYRHLQLLYLSVPYIVLSLYYCFDYALMRMQHYCRL